MNHVFFVNSGSEAADTALKIARAYHLKRGQGQRFRLIGREKGYHGITFGGLSVGGIGNNRKPYGPLLPGTDDHLPLPYDRATMGFTKGEPRTGADYADALENLVALHGAETIAAVIVEPMAGSAGVFASPKDYLKRLRALCDKHGILLIFDEVITGFGRLGHAFAAERYGVTPDMITFAKGVTNGAVPMGGTIVRNSVHDAFMARPRSRHRAVPRPHLFRPSARLRGGAGHARSLSRRRPLRACAERWSRCLPTRCTALKGAPLRRRYPQCRPGRRHRARSRSGRAGPPGL